MNRLDSHRYCNQMACNPHIFKNFKHKGLKKIYLTGSTVGIQAIHAKWLRLILSNLDHAECIKEMDLPGLRLHELIGSRKGTWSVTVNGNWRITFKFNGRDAEIVNHEDYH